MPKLHIPQTAEEMQAMMDDPKVAAQIIQEGQWTEFNRAYAKATDSRGDIRDMVVEAVQATMAGSTALQTQMKTSAEEIVAGLLKEHGVTGRPGMGSPAESAKQAAAYNKFAPGVRMEEAAFANIGDFARTVFNKGRPGDARLLKAIEVMNAYSSTDPSSGGFLVPETMRAEIYDLVLEQSIVRPRASVIQMGPGTQLIPFVDQTTHVGSVFGGMSFSRVKESGTVTPTEAKFGRVRLDPSKLMGTARVPNELWADAPALSSWLMSALPRGLSFFEDVDFITGNGGDEPLGVQRSNAAITVPKETGQAATTVVVENILSIYSRMLPQSLGNAVWLVNPTTFPQLMLLSVPVGTGGAPVNLVNIQAAPTPTLLGRPMIMTEKVPALGSAGDVGLYDLGFYLIGDRQSLSVESSDQSRFANDETEIKAIVRNDGKPWIQSAITPLNGLTLSPFVLLEARS